MDSEGLCNLCNPCKKMSHKPSFEEWRNTSLKECHKNYDRIPVMMETEVAVRMWCRPLEDKFRYVIYVVMVTLVYIEQLEISSPTASFLLRKWSAPITWKNASVHGSASSRKKKSLLLLRRLVRPSKEAKLEVQIC